MLELRSSSCTKNNGNRGSLAAVQLTSSRSIAAFLRETPRLGT